MPDDARMSILDDSNAYRGVGPDDSTPAERLRTARRIAVGSLILAITWGFGLSSLIAILTGLGSWRHLRVEGETGGYLVVAKAAVVLGVIGLIAGAAVALASYDWTA